MNSVLSPFVAIFCLVSLAEAQNTVPKPTATQTMTQPSGNSLNVNVSNGAYVVGQGAYTTIQSAVTAASTHGVVIIPPTYAGTDTWTNINNVHVIDERQINPGNAATYSSQTMPGTTVKAAEYGALCNGTNDDYPAINAAVSALTSVIGITQANSQPMVAGTVELPQGRCTISAPIVLMNYGSIQGSASGTWLTPGPAWSAPAGSAMINIVESYNQSLYHGQNITTINRFVKGINFYYNANGHRITGVKVYNQTGSSTTYPYPSPGSNPQEYQIPGVILEENSFFAMDTAIDLEDCGECTVEKNQINFVRLGINDGANNYSLLTLNNTIQLGTFRYTPVSPGPSQYSVGIFSASQVRPTCVGGTGQSCTGGTISNVVIASPQGLNISNTTIEAFDQDALIVNCLGLIVSKSAMDNGGVSGQHATVFLGLVNWAYIVDSFIATGRTDSSPLEIVAATTDPTDARNLDGVWLLNNFIYSYNPSAAAGIILDSGTHARRNVYMENNQFFRLAHGILVNSPLKYSIVRGNYGFLISGTLIEFNAAGSTSFQGTAVEDNTVSDNVSVFSDLAGGGFTLGFNQSPSQLTGTQIASGSGCTITAGAMGNACVATVKIPNAYANNSYSVAGCTITAGSGTNTTGTVGATNSGYFSVVEIAMTNTAAGGGTINCVVNHN